MKPPKVIHRQLLECQYLTASWHGGCLCKLYPTGISDVLYNNDNRAQSAKYVRQVATLQTERCNAFTCALPFNGMGIHWLEQKDSMFLS